MGCWRLVTAGVHWASSTDGKQRRDGSSGAQLRGKKGALTESADYMRGVINLRGSVVPVVDLRLQFGMQATVPTIDTCILIADVRIDGQPTVLGALADSVQEVIEFRRDQLEPAPRLGTRVDTEFIRAIDKHDDKFVIILDMNRVFSTDQLTDIQDGSQSAPPDDPDKPVMAEQGAEVEGVGG